MKARFLQFSGQSNNNPVLDYYKRVWSNIPGYAYPSPHYLEVPTWVAVISGILGDNWEKAFRVVDEETNLSPDYIYFGSVLDINLWQWQALVKNNPLCTFVLGGYVDKKELQFDTVLWVDSVADLPNVVPDCRPGKVDYSLFTGVNCIPRLTLSTGCLHDCAFCTIARQVSTLTLEQVYAQVESFHPLAFEYVYLDDKTFGQAKNWTELPAIYATIKRYNPHFRGFIVQTTATMAAKWAYTWVKQCYVKVIEIGVETINDTTLKEWHKPHNVRQINQAVSVIRALQETEELYFIPNLILGITGEDYKSTIEWLETNRDVISFVNPYLLCKYHDSKGNGAGVVDTSSDADETSFEKSWLTQDEQVLASVILDKIMGMF